MRRAFLALPLVLGAALLARSADASVRSFVYTRESRVLGAGQSALEPWTTFRVGQSRYYSALDGRLALSHGVTPGLQLALYWNFATQTRDVVSDSLTGQLSRVTSSEFSSASAEAKYQLSDPAADLLGSALYLAATLGPRQSALEAKLIFDRSWGAWLLAANLSGELELEPIRNEAGSELQAGLVLEPTLAAAYQLPHGASVGVELRSPLGVAGSRDSATLFGGPVLRWAHSGYWAALGAEPQLLAFSGKSPSSRLDLQQHERLEVRLLAGFSL